MAHVWNHPDSEKRQQGQDPYTWNEGFVNVGADSSAGDPPQATQFPGGRDKATLIIDYEVELSDPAGTITLAVQLYNKKRDTYQDWYTTALQEGNHTIKVDIIGRPGGLKIKDVVNATLNWLDWTIADRATAGN